VGRIVDFKYYPLKRFIEDLNKISINNSSRYELIIVGEGDYLDILKNEIIRYKSISFKFIKNIEYSELGNFITQEADIMIAMGTSALDGAKLGMPTLILDFGYEDMPKNYKYRWVHQSIEFSLSEFIGLKILNQTGDDLAIKINELESSYQKISNKEREYFQSNHDLGVISRMLIGYLKDSSCQYAELKQKKFFRRGLIYNLFSYIRNIFIHSNAK